MKPIPPKKNILVIRLSAMGDVAMATIVLYQFTRQNPSVNITVVTKPPLKVLFEKVPNTTVIEIDTVRKHKGFWGLYRFFKQLEKENFDAVVDWHSVLRSKILGMFFTLVKTPVKKINKQRSHKKKLTARTPHKNLCFTHNTHELYANVLRKFGFKVNLENPVFLPAQKIKNTAQKIIGIAPFGAYENKTYPIDLMQKVITLLLEKTNAEIFLFGAANQREKLNYFSKNKRVKNTAGKMTLKEELACIATLSCMVSMDSSNGHFSAMYGVPTITIWGATHPCTGFVPFAQPLENSILPNLEKYPMLPSSVYGNKIFKGYENVMQSIKPVTITEKIIDIINK